jgi:hypothetical protein
MIADRKRNTGTDPAAGRAAPGPAPVLRGLPGLIAGLMAVPWLVLGVWLLTLPDRPGGRKQAPVTRAAPADARVFPARPGPWGELECTRIAIEPPEEFVPLDQAVLGPLRWHFPGSTREAVAGLIVRAGLTAGQQASLLDTRRWEITPDGVRIDPDEETVLGLSPRARQQIYAELARHRENTAQQAPFVFHPAYLEEAIEASGLATDRVAELRRLVYPQGASLLLADANLLLQRAADRPERMRLLKTLARSPTLLVKLRVRPDSDLDALTDYWGVGGRSKDLRPLLASLARVPDGSILDITHLLPGLARRHLYTFPFPTSDPRLSRRDCHWTTLNFFNAQPDDRFVEPAVAREAIESGFAAAAGGARLGDVVLWQTGTGEIVHSAVYIADDIVFTKNGAIPTAPWLLMRLDEVSDEYASKYPAATAWRVTMLRRKAG